jgi:hypothetical protein
MRNARIEVLSYWDLEKLPVAEAMTWLDKVVVESKELAFRDHGFGVEVKTALAERRNQTAPQSRPSPERLRVPVCWSRRSGRGHRYRRRPGTAGR